MLESALAWDPENVGFISKHSYATSHGDPSRPYVNDVSTIFVNRGLWKVSK